jgi:parvulin-like peptidyl-prolyl isomerase
VRAEDARRRSSRARGERRRQNLAIAIGAALILVIFGIVAFGYYREFYEPPRVTAGEIRGVKFTMGDLVDRIRVLQGIRRYQGGFVDLSVVPFEYLQDLLNAEILRQAAPGLGVTITDDEIEEALKDQFYPTPPDGQDADPGQLDREFDNNYTGFLTQVRLTDEEYRDLVSEQLLGRLLTVMFAGTIPEQAEQVEVEWIRMELQDNNVDPLAVRERLDEEEFANVAAEVGSSAGFSDFAGYVGWVPRGAFPDLDETLFGSEGNGEDERKVEPLPVGEISDPVFLQEGVYIIHKIAGPEERELDVIMQVKLAHEMVEEWRNEQLSRGSKEGWLKINFDSDRYAWVADQVRLTAPRVEQAPPGNQGGLPVGGP